jgi:hypothetical protein
LNVLDQPVPTRVGAHYVHVSYHRNRTRKEKSQWTVAMDIEVEIFAVTFESSAQALQTLWGLWLLDGKAQVVGVSRAENPPQYGLKISRFQKNDRPEYWHGYPADYRAHPHDRPPTSVLQGWRVGGIISKADVSRIRGGRPCGL